VVGEGEGEGIGGHFMWATVKRKREERINTLSLFFYYLCFGGMY